MKFVANIKLTEQSISFENIENAVDAPLIKALFNFPYVKEIFLVIIVGLFYVDINSKLKLE